MLAAAAAPLSPWTWFETRYDDGVVVRVAQTREDAEAARLLIRDAWGVSDDERYFYRLFEDAQILFDSVIAPSQRTTDLRELDAICFVIDALDDDGRRVPVGTFSFVFDHVGKVIELGRGAIARAWQQRKIPAQAVGPMRRFLELLPDYAVIADATTLARGAKTVADAVGCATVALHPSSFTVQPDAVAGWQRKLSASRGEALGLALLRRSTRTGLGRFMTSFHCRPPAGLIPAKPVLSESQRPFFEHTCAASRLDVEIDGAAIQSARPREPELHDNRGTATRTLVDPSAKLDVAALIAESDADGFETVIVQVPCDARHLELGVRLEAAGALLSGVFVDADGDWRASYTLLTSPEVDAQVRGDLEVLVDEVAFDRQTMPLLRLILAHARQCGRLAAEQQAA